MSTLLTVIFGIFLVGCAQDESFGNLEQVQIREPESIMTTGNLRTVYQSTQVIPLALLARTFPSKSNLFFGVENLSASKEIIPFGINASVPSGADQGYDYRIRDDRGFDLKLYPYAKPNELVQHGANTAVLTLSEAGQSSEFEFPVFHVEDFTTYSFLTSAPSELSTFWMDATARPTTASDGSMLIGTGVGAGVLFQ
jgi:hypothetical protein